MQILFEDEFIISVLKPAMVLSQPSFDKKRIAVQQQLEIFRPDLVNKLYLHHRLDYETSGVFLLSKSSAANKPLTEMFKNHHFEKTYVCLTRPNVLDVGKKVTCTMSSENENTWTIKNFMAPAKGMGGGKRRMISVKAGGWAAETEFTILSSHATFHFVQAKPKTGRTHQIRQHLQESYRSILGDNIYGGKSADVPRLMLHAQKLQFNHPITNQAILIEAALPKDFESCLHKV